MHPPLAHPRSGTPKEDESTTEKGENARCFCSARSPRAHIPFVFRDNLLRSSQIAVAFAAPLIIPPVARWPGKVGYFWGSRWGVLGRCPQSGRTLSFPHGRRIWVTKIAFFWWLYADILWRDGELQRFPFTAQFACTWLHLLTSSRVGFPPL